MKLPQKKGNRIRASDKSLVFIFSVSSLLLLFVCVLVLLNLKTILSTDWKSVTLFQDGSIHFTVTPYMIGTVIVSALICVIVAFFYQRFQYDKVKQLYHRQKLARMILENGWYEVESSQDGDFFKDLPLSKAKEKITYFPKIYYRMEHGLLYIQTEITLGNIKTSSYIWKRNWKQACTVSWCQKSCMILTWNMCCFMTLSKTVSPLPRYRQKTENSV